MSHEHLGNRPVTCFFSPVFLPVFSSNRPQIFLTTNLLDHKSSFRNLNFFDCASLKIFPPGNTTKMPLLRGTC